MGWKFEHIDMAEQWPKGRRKQAALRVDHSTGNGSGRSRPSPEKTLGEALGGGDR